MIRLVLAALLCSAAFAADRHVILISVDGFAAYAWRDPKLPVPNLRRLAREGAAADRLQVVNPSVTWPNHTSMVTGVTPARHGVLYNGLALRGADRRVTVEPWRPKTDMVRAVTVYDLAHKAGLTTAEVDWVAIMKAPTITWAFPERPDAEGVIEKEMIAAGLLTTEDIATFSRAPITYRDEVWTRAAIHILEKHRPNLLLYHLLTTDSVQHRYGPKNLAMSTALSLADARVGELLAALERSWLRDRTTVLVAADHGFKTVLHHIRPRVEGTQIIPEGGTAMVYVDKAADRAAVRQKLAALEGIAAVYDAGDFPKLGLPTPDKHDGMPEFVIAAREGYSFAGGTGEGVQKLSAPEGSHGYLASDPEMDGIFIVWGAGVKPGRLDAVRTIDIAPTVAHLLGLEMKDVEGRVLDEALR